MRDVHCTEEDPGSTAAQIPVVFSEIAFEFADSTGETTRQTDSRKLTEYFITFSIVAENLIMDLKHASQLLHTQYLTGQRLGESCMMQR